MPLSDCRIIDLPKIVDTRGNLTFVEEGVHIPFCIRRVYFTYDLPAGTTRGGHAHKELHQFIIATTGSFDVSLRDGVSEATYHLNRPYLGLYICPMIWRELSNFSSGSVCLVLASHYFSEDDYYRDYSEYCAAVAASSSRR